MESGPFTFPGHHSTAGPDGPGMGAPTLRAWRQKWLLPLLFVGVVLESSPCGEDLVGVGQEES